MDNNLLEYYKETYFSSELPIPFHLKDEHLIYINPIKVRDYPIYASSIGLFMIDKNKISDARIISMSYLKFMNEIIITGTEEEQKYNMQLMINVLILSLGEQYNYHIHINEKDKAELILRRKSDNERIVVTSKEFDQIKSIILALN